MKSWREEVAAMPEGIVKDMATAAFSGSTFRWEVEREHIQPGRSFSREALDLLRDQLLAFVEARCMVRWEMTGEPPSKLWVELRVVAS